MVLLKSANAFSLGATCSSHASTEGGESSAELVGAAGAAFAAEGAFVDRPGNAR